MKKIYLYVTLGLIAVSCGDAKKDVQEIGNVQELNQAVGPESKLEEKLKLMMPVDVDNKVLQSMKPTKEDVEYLFQNDEDVALVLDYIEKTYARLPKSGFVVGEKRKEILIHQRNTDVLKTERDENFPDQYYEMADKFHRGRTIYAVEFTESGKEFGKLPLNLFVYHNEKWVFFPRVYRAFAGVAQVN